MSFAELFYVYNYIFLVDENPAIFFHIIVQSTTNGPRTGQLKSRRVMYCEMLLTNAGNTTWIVCDHEEKVPTNASL